MKLHLAFEIIIFYLNRNIKMNFILKWASYFQIV